jgi:xanthine dehydrogenase accessory factor
VALFGTDREVLQTAIDWLAQGHRPLLVTVARTWGSSPRPPGSLMLMRADGRYFGSVSGGCVEQDLVERYTRGELAASYPTLVDYGVDRSEATRMGLPCGGRLELLVEELQNPAHLHGLLEAIASGRPLARRVCLDTGEVSLHAAAGREPFSYCENYLQKTFGPEWLMLLIGAGQLSDYVAQIAQMLDYRVVVCDPRGGESDQTGVTGCEQTTDMPDDAVRAWVTHPRCAVVALTHDPRLDDMALVDALASPAFYVGAIGSQRNCDKRRERLKSLGLSTEQLQNLNAPVGLPIGSHSPPEIAVSIVAGITAVRNGVRLVPDVAAGVA